MHDPDLLVLDEPTTGVDPLSRRQFWELIDSIRARRPQMSVIVATAYMDEASRFDWLAAMDDGKVIAHGVVGRSTPHTSEDMLDDAFIALLPPEKRGQHQEVIVRPRAESDDQTPAIETDGLTRRFGDFVAVDHVSFRIGRGEIFGFLGSNGCGKTTTMKMMTGLLPVTEGSAKLFGKPMAADDMEARENVGYMSQAFSLYSELTVRQNLELHAHLYHLQTNEIRGRLSELLERYDLKEVADAKPESLLAALAIGALLYVFSTCSFGQVVSTFTKTQVAAVFATTVIAIIPTVNFSGLLVPVSSLTGQGRLIGLMFPAAWFQPISVGTFTKALGFSDLWFNALVLAIFTAVYFTASHLFLHKQET